MPELPEVEHSRCVAERVAVGRTIRRVTCQPDPIVFEGVSPQRFRKALLGRRVNAAGRHGKHFWLELDARPWPLFHLGMTGSVRTRADEAIELASSPRRKDESWPPRFMKLLIELDDGGAFAITNKRRLGRIRLRHDPRAEPPVASLGFDPLLDMPSPKAFHELVRSRSAILKPLLLDQTFAAGVGNWIADEVLYQARLDPRRRASDLDDEEIRRMRRVLKSVIKRAVDANADNKRFPRTWLFHRRWGKQRDAHTTGGDPIVHITLGGRTTAWVPTLQS